MHENFTGYAVYILDLKLLRACNQRALTEFVNHGYKKPTTIRCISLVDILQYTSSNKTRHSKVDRVSEVCKRWYFNRTKRTIESCLITLFCLQVNTIIEFLSCVHKEIVNAGL